ncbi:MAG: aromatic ring-hydroxylating dioxygenase subunit alpha [Acidimicrobiia bacterium]
MTDAQTFSAVPNDEVSFLGTEPIPAAPYFDPTYHEMERDAVFRRCWLHIGRESEVAAPNSFIVRELDVARTSILVTRTADGELRAFHNFCTHRGTELVSEPCGNASSFSCRYHAWNFANDGSLRAAPDERRFFDFDKAGCGLRPVAIDTCAGFVFVNLDPQPVQGLHEFLGPIAAELEALDLASYTDFAQYSYEVDANWKVTFDNFQETYHLRFVHEGSTRGNATGPDNPYGYPTRFRFLDPHRTMTLWSKTGSVLTDVQTKAVTAGFTTGDIRMVGDREYYGLFPNFFVAPYAGLATFTHQVWPLGPERTRGIVRVYFRGAVQSASMRFAREYALAQALEVHVEDRDVIEAGQRGLRSGAIRELHFQAQEAACRHLFLMVDAWVRNGGAPA